MHTPTSICWHIEPEMHMCPLSTTHPYLSVEGDLNGDFEVEDNFEVVVNGDLIWSKKTRREEGLPDTKEKVCARTYGHNVELTSAVGSTVQPVRRHTHTLMHPYVSPLTG